MWMLQSVSLMEQDAHKWMVLSHRNVLFLLKTENRGHHLHFYGLPDFKISISCLSFLNHSFYHLSCMHFCLTKQKRHLVTSLPSEVITPSQFYIKHLPICNLYKWIKNWVLYFDKKLYPNKILTFVLTSYYSSEL